MFNTGARNDAQSANLAARQNISNSNAEMNNSQQQYNKQLQQQDYENKLKKAGGQSGVAQANAAAAGANSKGSADAFNNLIGIGATMGGAYLGGPMGAAAAKKVTGKAEGGLVMGDPSDHDTMPHMLQPGEMVIKKEDVPEMLKRKHTGDDGDFDAAAFLDDITGGKYGYKKGKK